MNTAIHDRGSFRDPAGQVYHLDGRILRSVSRIGASNYEFARDSGVLADATARGMLIAAKEVPRKTLGAAGEQAAYVLEHPAIPFVSYPYEWTFSALRAAALLHLKLLKDALDRSVTLSDASGFNIQFIGAKPIYIDTLSFCRYDDGDYWTAHRQFCDQFLNPLLLTAYRGVPFNGWFRGNLNGISAADLDRLLSWRQKLNWRVLTHVTLPVHLESPDRQKTKKRLDRFAAKPFPRASFQRLIDGLHSWIGSLKGPGWRHSQWAGYAEDNSYGPADAEAKADFTRRAVASVKPSVLWDIGCNTGHYSEIALRAGAGYVVGFDTDRVAVEKAFARAEEKELSFLPLTMDIGAPSPAQGWMGHERMSLDDRGPADMVLAHAILHHLCIGQNIPLQEAVDWLIGSAPQGVIEFVAKDDPMVQLMLGRREDIFADYHRDAFLSYAQKRAEIVETKAINQERRLLLWYRRVGR